MIIWHYLHHSVVLIIILVTNYINILVTNYINILIAIVASIGTTFQTFLTMTRSQHMMRHLRLRRNLITTNQKRRKFKMRQMVRYIDKISSSKLSHFGAFLFSKTFLKRSIVYRVFPLTPVISFFSLSQFSSIFFPSLLFSLHFSLPSLLSSSLGRPTSQKRGESS